MYAETIDKFATLAASKANFLLAHRLGFLISSMMAGVYVGLGIILIFSLGNDIDPPWAKLVMGTSFGIALTLVVFAGADLFTGLTMYMTQDVLARRSTLREFGSMLLALLFTWPGGGNTVSGAVFMGAAYRYVSAPFSGMLTGLVAEGVAAE